MNSYTVSTKPLPLQFISAAFVEQPVIAKRFAALKSLIATEEWWSTLLKDWCFIAGGAALFVADLAADIDHVGDIDIWFAPNQTCRLEWHILELCRWFKDQNIGFSFRMQHGNLKIFNEKIQLQFIAVMPPGNDRTFASLQEMVELVLANFDYEPVQFAVCIKSVVREKADTTTFVCSIPSIFMTEAASQALHTRHIVWRNTKMWDQTAPCFNSPAGYHKKRDDKRWTRDRHRLAKLARKGFFVSEESETKQYASKAPLSRDLFFDELLPHSHLSLMDSFRTSPHTTFETFVAKQAPETFDAGVKDYALNLDKVGECAWQKIRTANPPGSNYDV